MTIYIKIVSLVAITLIGIIAYVGIQGMVSGNENAGVL